MARRKVLLAFASVMIILLVVYGFIIKFKHIAEIDIMSKLPIYQKDRDTFNQIKNDDVVNREPTIIPSKEIATPLLTSGSARKSRKNPKQLLFSYIPKAGSSEIQTILSIVVGGEIEIFGGSEYISRYQANKTTFFKNNFFLQNERQQLKPDMKSSFFVVGHVQAPCNYLLSSWTYGSDGNGNVYKMAKDKSVYGVTPPYNNKEDLDRLTMWLQDNKNMYTNRLTYKYFKTAKWKTDMNLRSADCWIHTEMLIYDLVNCLKRYEKQGGNVKWENFRKIKTKIENPSNHSQCGDYFDDERTALVMDSNMKMAKIFRYESCCVESNTTLPAGFEELWTNHN
ncbi:unnamed protein product [Owenia fusiformis]|uniref:Uncharacterized protein n=1 Tax=Owenia fusiformis TaxID=6347 RepID=A0A8J1UV02_OWEFU|nr:unnamed protein product [Owenia fusiformis]